MQEDNTYTIKKYFENHEAVLVAVFSAVVALLTFLINAIIHFFYIIYLHKWNISSEIIGDIKSNKFFYSAICGFIFYAILPVFTIYIQKTCTNRIALLWLLKQQKKLIKKEKKYLHKEKEFIHKEKLYNEQTINEYFKKIQRNIRSTYRYIISICIVFLFVPSLLYTSLLVMFVICISESFWTSIASSVLIMVIIMICLYINFRFSYSEYNRKTLKKKQKKVTDYSEAIALVVEMVQLEKRINNKREEVVQIHYLISNAGIKKVIQNGIYGFIGLSIWFVLLGIVSDIPKNYWIYQSENHQQYAVVYQGNDIMVLEKALIQGNTISIDTDEQLFLQRDDKSFTYMKFKNAKILK